MNDSKEILTRLKKIENLLLSEKKSFDDYISEQKAMEIFQKSTTWFYNQRRAGLPFVKIGSQVYYEFEKLIAFFQDRTKFESN